MVKVTWTERKIKIETQKTENKKTWQHTKTEQEKLKGIHTQSLVVCKKHSESLHRKMKTFKPPEAAVTLLTALRLRRQPGAMANHPPDPLRCHLQKKNGL